MKKLTLNVGRTVAISLTAAAVFITPLTVYSQGRQIEEITITARKTTESLQEVPLAITALGADEIERLGIKDLSSVVQTDSSVQFDEGFTPSDTRITIRGLSPTRGRPNAASLVDGIDLTSEAVSNAGGTQLINPRLLDIERIEIVKGPQSALYGRSAFAGAIQYVTKDPSDVLEGDVSVEGNSEDAQEIRGSVSIPLTDTLGMRINAAAFDSRGIYKNVATGDYVGGGDGAGGSITFKWEPTDTLSFKWRTEYSDDNFDVAPQTLLSDRNRLIDLGTLIPGNLSSNCFTAPGQPAPGPLDNYGCAEGAQLNTFFTDGNPTDPAGNPKDLGQFDPTDPWQVAQYNKQVISAFVGKFPDGDDLDVALSPDYQRGTGATNPANAKDFDGTEKDVFRTSLVAEWAPSDDVTFNSYTSYLDAKVYESLDIGKYFVDECSQNIGAIQQPGTDPLGGGGSYADAILANNPQLTTADLAAFAPCSLAGPDGINDANNGFAQNSKTETTQLSQEFRGAWQIGESVNFTSGLLYWYEDVELISNNSTTVAGGPQCYLGLDPFPPPPFSTGNDASIGAGSQAFFQLNDFQDQCGRTGVTVAFWQEETYQGRLIQPDTTDRNVKHYSWYGSLDWDVTDKFSARLEARFTREDNQVTAPLQNPCLDPTATIGDPNCTNSPADRTEIGAGGNPTGPSAVLLCGQVGRCDRLGLAPQSGSPYYAGNQGPQAGQFDGFSWWNWGYLPMPGTPTTIKKTDRFWAPKATFEYYWNDDIMTYFSWSRGIKPGGFSLQNSGAFGLDANLDGNFDEVDFDPERLDVWEIGAKTTLFDGTVRLNSSVFYQDFKDKQVSVQFVVADTVGTKVENISGSEIWGAEFEGTWQINDNWRVSGGYTYLDTEYTDYEIVARSANDIGRIQLGNGKGCTNIAVIPGSDPSDPEYGCAASFNGNELERAPKHAFQGTLNFTDDLLDTGYEWYTEASFRYQDSRYNEAFNIVEYPSYSITDWRIGIIADDWEVTGFVDNVFDDDTIITGGNNPGIPTGSFGFGSDFSTIPPGINAGPKLPQDVYAQLPNPRIAGVRATFRFGQ